MKLTRSQVEYARHRINALTDAKYKEEVSKLTKPAEPKDLPPKEKWALVLSGKVKINPRYTYKLESYDGLYLDNFDFPVDKKAETAMEKYKADCSAIETKYKELTNNALDKLMLAGDADAALAIVESLK